MSKRKPKQYEDEPDEISLIGTGSYSFNATPKNNKPVIKVVGFVRPKVKKRTTNAQRPKKTK